MSLVKLSHTPQEFRGLARNIMTPNVIGYWRIKHRYVTRYVEISEGRGLNNQPIFGVSVKPEPEHVKLSELHQSLPQAMAYLSQLDEGVES